MKSTSLARLAMLLIAAVIPPAQADTFPAKPVKIVVPFSPGGTPDLAARLIAQRLSTAWKSPVVVENRPGAGSMLGADLVSKSPADGYTWLMASDGTMIINPVAGNAPYDALKDFAPVTLVARVPFLLVVNSSLPVRSVAELIQYAKANPGKLNYASAGNGTPQHLAMEMLKHSAGLDITHVPYKGAAPVITDLLANRVQVFVGSPNTLVQHINDGKLRALASAGSRRAVSFAELPTISETVPSVAMDIWMGIFLPASVPQPIVDRINTDIAAILNAPDVKSSLAEKQFLEVSTTQPEALRDIVREGQDRWGRVMREARIKLE
ncbi:MAG: Bug family tripartite tricarboxylate transporter substrate binding protein [Burkholderiaceae bacterium]